LSIYARKHNDFPAPIPGYLTFTPRNQINNSLIPNGFGEPPYDITGDLRLRISPHTVLDIQRSYYFNFGNMGWSPQFALQVTR